jgi:hypothetical protein
MTDNTSISIIILSFIAFIYLIVWGSLNYLEEGAIFLSFITMLEAILILFAAYTLLREELEESFRANEATRGE